MLNLIAVTPPRSDRVLYTGRTARFADMRIYGRWLDGVYPVKLFSGRSPYDYIRNLGAIDDLGNTQVIHQTLDGNLSIPPKINGKLAKIGGLSDGDRSGVSDVTLQPVDDAGYAILNYGDVGASRIYAEGRDIYASFGTIFGDQVDRKADTGYVIMTARWNNGSWMGGSITCYTPNYDLQISLNSPDLQSGREGWLNEATERWRYFIETLYRSYVQLAKVSLHTYLLTEARESWSGRHEGFHMEIPPTPKLTDLWSEARTLVNIGLSDPTTPVERSTAAREAIEALNSFDSNLIAYASDLRKTGDSLKSILGLARNFRSPKAWADAWLSGRFGDRLTISDTRELLESLQKSLKRTKSYSQGRSVIKKHFTTTRANRTYTVDIERKFFIIAYNESYNDLMTAVSNLMRWDAWPTLENTWDLIPLSFVVDWFIPVQGILGQIDAAIEAPYIRAKSQYQGFKRLVSMNMTPSESCPICGTLVLRNYSRTAHNVLSDVRPFESVVAPPSFSVVNMGDALALLVQTSKKA